MKLDVFLIPSKTLSEVPIKTFYRYVYDPITFSEDGKLNQLGIAQFKNLPQTKILTMNVHTPSSWLITSNYSLYDLDNILLNTLNEDETRVYAEFQLDHILVEGSCIDVSNKGIPPRGLELILGDRIKEQQVDSLVMSNLGYYQLKANPGVWIQQLASGRANSTYRIGEVEKKLVVVDSFIGVHDMLEVRKRPGFEKVSLFDDEETKESPDLWGKISGFFSTPPPPTPSTSNETLHIFSLASGHLYERFLKIMVLSVLQHTKSPVKFWFISNFLSPKFKEFIPKMAKHYNFEVELVTYKWPAWLHKQTVKQRIIWGYKILFLDVLFPLSLKKVIYVDADQIVRTDLKELWDMDLQGAGYGYTPFCQGEIKKEETSGFRFWESGYWREHLRGRPYHISALYVVDLQVFRKKGHGDTLRATYDSLSKDPNSLSNLDQDLPNYLQMQVPIFSLPPEWLWCESWCTDESKSRAKTIDLCNNPLTKTPKLEAAVKIVPEWTGYDQEAKNFEKSLEEPNNIELESLRKAQLNQFT